MLNFLRAKHSRMLVWTLAVLIVVGLAGFGISNSGVLTTTQVATVGDSEIPRQEFARALDQEVRTLSQQLGRTLPMAEARQYGIENMVLGRLINDAALDEAAARLRLSAGDGVVRDQLVAIPAFKGPTGTFDRQTYVDTLRRNGLEPARFENEMRREITRQMVSASVQSAVTEPEIAVTTVLGYLGERRGFDWLRLDATQLTEPVPAPTEAQIAEEYKAHPDRYTSPETREITYVSMTPESLAAKIDVPEADLRAAYEAAADRYHTPEKRALDRIGFGTEAEAEAAKARLDSGEIDFDALAAERGFTPDQTDQGEVAASALPAAARDVIFGAAGPGIVGPVPSALGPSIYRINAILAATSVPFETARDELRQERALKLAADKITEQTASIEDLVAGGATLEEIAKETDMTLGTIALSAQSSGGIADDTAFRDLATKTEPGDATDIAQLASGGIVSLRVDAVKPPALMPLDTVKDRVIAAWTADETDRRLKALAEGFAAEIAQGTSLDALATRLGLQKQTEAPITRGEVVPGTPPALLTDIFAAAPNGTVVTPDTASVILGQVTAIAPFDPSTEQNKAIVLNARSQFTNQAANDALALLTSALRNAAGVTVNQSAIDAVMTQFP